MSYEHETPVPTLHVAPQNRTIIGYQPVYGPSQQNVPLTNAPVTPGTQSTASVRGTGVDVALVGIGVVLIAVCTWLVAGSYYGSRSIEQAQEKADAALAYAQQLQSENDQQRQTLDALRELLGCFPGSSHGH